MPFTCKTMFSKKVLVVVAHPDDETIWTGGIILKNKSWKFTIISLCRKNDKDRTRKFRKACKFLNAECFISDLDDEKLEQINLDEVKKRIREFLDEKFERVQREFDYIFTHGENGEYGHVRHINVHNAVKEMTHNGELKCKKIFYFAYKKSDKGNFCLPDTKANKFINLSDLVFLEKKNLIREIYGFEEGSFEEKSCGRKEAFNIEKVK